MDDTAAIAKLRAGAHPLRLRILSLLTGAEMSAAEVAIPETRSSFPVLTNVAMAVAISKKREVRKKRSAGSAGTPVTDAEAAIGDHFILALQRLSAENAARNDNDYRCTDGCGPGRMAPGSRATSPRG